MATLGPNDLKQYAIPTSWDASKLMSIRLESGETYDQFISDVSAGLSMKNAELLSNPLYAGLISLTTDASLEYPVGNSNGFEEATEYGRPDPKRAGTTGHMLPLIEYDRGFSWTWMFLKKARRAQLDADIASGMKDVQDIWEKKILTRLFKSTYDSVGTGKSMPLADAGTADSTYIPMHNLSRAAAFTSSHDHIHHLNGITQANLETAVANIWQHGHDAPYTLLISAADISSWTNTTNVTGWIPKSDSLIRYGNTQDLANVAAGYIGAVDTKYGACQVWANGRLPTTNWSVYKSYGPLDARNPLRVRYNPRFGVGAVLLAGDHIRDFPLENAILWMEFGVGVADRVAATAYQNNNSAYADPTIA